MLEATADILPESPDRITVLCDFRSKDSVKAVPGAKWSTTTRHWTIPLTWPACLAIRAEFGEGLKLGPELRAWAKDISPLKKQMRDLRPVIDRGPPKLSWDDSDLFDHQVIDAMCISLAKRYLIMNGTGTGKTRSALAGLALLHRTEPIFPCLITAPKTMLYVWADEIVRYFPDAKISVVSGTPAVVRKALEPGFDFYIVGWDSLRKHTRLANYGSIALSPEEKEMKSLNAIDFKACIFDEAHRAKNPTSKRTRAAWYIGEGCDIRIGLTGSPIQDTIEDLYGLLHLFFPDEYPTKTAYIERYAEVDWNEWGGRDVKGIKDSVKDEFYANFDAVSRRITKDMAGLKLPPKLNEIRWVTLPPKMRKAYNEMKKTYVAALTDGSSVAAANPMVRQGRLIQLANGEMLTDPTDPDKFVFDPEGDCPKVDQFIEDLVNGDFGDEQIVVFSELLGVLDVVQEKLDKPPEKHKPISWVRIDGSVTGEDRKAAIDKFQNGEARVCLLTRAGGEGITLTAASVMVRLVRSWSLTIHQQSEDRVHRIGSEIHESILYVDYLVEDSVEEDQVIRLNAKDARSREALRDDELLAMLKREGRPTLAELMGEK